MPGNFDPAQWEPHPLWEPHLAQWEPHPLKAQWAQDLPQSDGPSSGLQPAFGRPFLFGSCSWCLCYGTCMPSGQGIWPSPAPPFIHCGDSLPPGYPGKRPCCSSAPSHTATPSGTFLLSHRILCLLSESEAMLVRTKNIHMGAVYTLYLHLKSSLGTTFPQTCHQSQLLLPQSWRDS